MQSRTTPPLGVSRSPSEKPGITLSTGRGERIPWSNTAPVVVRKPT